MHLTAVYQKTDEWYVAWIEEIRGVNTQGKTMEEARTNLNEALQLMLECLREEAAAETEGVTVVREALPITFP